MNDYESCDAYQIKGPGGICMGDDADRCTTCPLRRKYEELNQTAQP